MPKSGPVEVELNPEPGTLLYFRSCLRVTSTAFMDDVTRDVVVVIAMMKTFEIE
jgi:hypothetical protein